MHMNLLDCKLLIRLCCCNQAGSRYKQHLQHPGLVLCTPNLRISLRHARVHVFMLHTSYRYVAQSKAPTSANKATLLLRQQSTCSAHTTCRRQETRNDLLSKLARSPPEQVRKIDMHCSFRLHSYYQITGVTGQHMGHSPQLPAPLYP